MAGITSTDIPIRTRISRASGYSQETVVLNEYGLTSRSRTNKKGKTTTRQTIQISAEPLIQNFSALELGKAPANALAKIVKDQIMAVPAEAKPLTIESREAALAVMNGTSETEPSAEMRAWVKTRYAGGKIGTMPPKGGTQLFNDSGRLAMITLQPNRAYTNDAVWEVNVPKNRLDPSTWSGDMKSFLAMAERLQKLVPVLGNDRAAIMNNKEFVNAIAASVEQVFAANDQRIAGLRGQLAGAQYDLAFQLARGAFSSILGSPVPF